MSSVRKRARPQSQKHLQPPRSSDKKPKLTQDLDENDDNDVIVVTEQSTTILISDIDKLKQFFRHRFDELTMIPVRKMVTRWVKQLEPKRMVGYGPYHKQLPKDKPKNETPPWWPGDVPYVEPAHLDKEGKRFANPQYLLLTIPGLLTLAVDLVLQHRDTRADELKRQQPWTRKLRRSAELEVTMTELDHFSTSQYPAFSTAMKERAEHKVLPSLFDVMQSYEDFVNQHRLWTYSDRTKAPAGKSITWQAIPRPPLQKSRYKKFRPAEQERASEVLKIEHDEDFGAETEPDDTMTAVQLALDLANKALREAKAARRKAKAETTRAMSIHPVAAVEGASATPPMLAPRPMSRPVTPRFQVIEADDAKPITGVPTDEMTTESRLPDQDLSVQMTRDEGNSTTSHPEVATTPTQSQAHQIIFQHYTPQHEVDDIKEGSAMNSAYQTQSTPLADPAMNSPQQYQTVMSSVGDEDDAMRTLSQSQDVAPQLAPQDNQTYGALSSAGSFNSLASSSFNSFQPSSFASYPTHSFNPDLSEIIVLNQQYPWQGNQPYYSPAMGTQNTAYGCSSGPMYTSMDNPMSSVPSQANQTFNGLPYDFTPAQN